MVFCPRADPMSARNSMPKKFPLHRPQAPIQAGSAPRTHSLVEDWIITGGPWHKNLKRHWHKCANTLTHWLTLKSVSNICTIHSSSPYFLLTGWTLMIFTVNWANCMWNSRGFPAVEFILLKGSGRESLPGCLSFFVAEVYKDQTRCGVIFYPLLLFSCELCFARKETPWQQKLCTCDKSLFAWE